MLEVSLQGLDFLERLLCASESSLLGLHSGPGPCHTGIRIFSACHQRLGSFPQVFLASSLTKCRVRLSLGWTSSPSPQSRVCARGWPRLCWQLLPVRPHRKMDVPAPRASASAAALALALCKSSASSNEREPWERSHDPSSPLPSLESAKAARDCKASAEVIPVLALASCCDVLLQPAGGPPPSPKSSTR